MKGEKIRMKDLAERFHEVGVVPVVVLEDVKDAVPLAQALVEGGLPCAEVTFRTAAAEESIRLMTEKFPEMLVGSQKTEEYTYCIPSVFLLYFLLRIVGAALQQSNSIKSHPSIQIVLPTPSSVRFFVTMIFLSIRSFSSATWETIPTSLLP